jgi:hypothetical protein
MSSRMGVQHPLRMTPGLVGPDDEHVKVIDGLRIYRWWNHQDVIPVPDPWMLDGVRLDDAGDVDGITWTCEEAATWAELVDRIPGFLEKLLEHGVELSPRFLGRLNGVRDAEAVSDATRADPRRRIRL